MLVVRTRNRRRILYIQNRVNVVLLGLYYKLHGIHRPVTMKKGEIKRRKRVMPSSITDQVHIHVGGDTEQGAPGPADYLAMPEQTNQVTAATTSSPRSHLTGSPGHHTGALDEQLDPEVTSSRVPLPADFTQYQPHDTRSGVERSQLPSRKRSISAIEEMSGASNHPIITAARQAAVVTAIDPLLTDADPTTYKATSVSSPPPRPSQTQTTVQDSQEHSNSNTHENLAGTKDSTGKAKQEDRTQSDMAHIQQRKAERRRTLEAEAQRMREMLDAKEKELLALDEGENTT